MNRKKILLLIISFSLLFGLNNIYSLRELSVDHLLRLDDIDSRFQLAMVYFSQNNYNAAYDLLNHIRRNTSIDSIHNDRSFYWTGVIYMRQNKYNEAVKTFNDYLQNSKLHTFRINAIINIGDIYLTLNQNEKAISTYQKALLIFDNNDYNSYIFFKLGEAYLKTNMLNSAYNSYNKVINNYPSSTEYTEAIKRNNFIINRLEIDDPFSRIIESRTETPSTSSSTTFPSTIPATTPSTSPATSGHKFIIQVGAFRTRRSADNQVRTLNRHNISAYIISEDNLFKVRVGFFNTQREANDYLTNTLRPHNIDGFVVRTGM